MQIMTTSKRLQHNKDDVIVLLIVIGKFIGVQINSRVLKKPVNMHMPTEGCSTKFILNSFLQISCLGFVVINVL